MIEFIGIIECIGVINNNGKDKVVIDVNTQTDKNLKPKIAFVEFHGGQMKKTYGFSEGQKVCVRGYFNGKISKLGRRYNNIIGKSIKAS